MTNSSTAAAEHYLMAGFYKKVAELQDKRSFVSAWLEDFRDSLAKICGLEPAKAWDFVPFEAGVYVMLEIVDRMEKEHLLPAIDKYSYEQAKREWAGSETEVRALIQREMNFAMNTNLRGILEFFSLTLDGLPLENEGGHAHCYNELGRLFRMRRLSR